MDSIVPAIFATRRPECVKWSADYGLSVTSRLLDSLMKFLRAGRSVPLWINLDANTPDYTGGPIFGQVERFFDKTVALCSFELVNKHSDRR